MPERILAVMAKAPRLGQVKSRLAKDIGPVAAWRFYRTGLERLLLKLGRDARWSCRLMVTPDALARGHGLGLHVPAGVLVVPQGGGDLGARMGRVFQAHPQADVLIVGSDIPGITRAHIAGGFRALQSREVAIGPSPDGGYWLIGRAARARGLIPFEGVRWSSPRARADTVANIPAPYRVAELPVLRDVDRAEDLREGSA